ncbi:uncharacterized protein LOC111638866 [Centruroides sculpturatus]|uniref:uncharacterized protein LOC111638866 n=1 Tax=Centruroides sculpturatus TaxID=218467 RepID=UPI000C6E5838|nr:uncharacterized protein LOC111638866 [Centruroides sculpturatus]
MDSPDTPKLFGFAKTHKSGQQIRPVVDKNRAPTQQLEKLTHSLISPYLHDYPYAVNSSEQLAYLKQVDNPPQFLTVFDFKSLYPSILLPPTFCALRDLLFRIVNDANLQQQILEMTHLLCYNSLFQFRGKTYMQSRGVPMGSPIAGDLCELVIRQLEERVLPLHISNIILYRRYIDDILILWKVKPDISAFLELVNDNRYGLTLELDQAHDRQVHFLDISIKVDGKRIQTEVYRKLIAEPLYIPTTSCDPYHYKIAAFNTLIKRAYTHSSTKAALESEHRNIANIAKRHGYYNLMNKLSKKLRHPQVSARDAGQEDDRPEHKDRVPVTYNPWLQKLYSEIAKKKNINITYRRCPTVFNILRNAKDPPNNHMLSGVYTIPLKDHRCDEQLLYIGSTKRSLSVRLKEHIADIQHGRITTALARYATDPDIEPKFSEARIIHTTPHTEHLRWIEAMSIYKAARNNRCINNKEELSLSLAWEMLIQDRENIL